MSKYGIVSIIFISLIIGLFVIGIFVSLPLFIFFFLFLLYISILSIGSFSIRYNFFINAYNRGNRQDKKIAITFDDGPENSITPELLNILATHNVKTTFFCIGEKAEKNKELLRQMDAAGHIIGNHSFTHSTLFDFKLSGRMINEIERTNNAIEKIINKKPILFRPPYGITNPFLRKAIKKTNMTPIGWSLRSFDTIRDDKQVMKRIRKNIKEGDIILLHDKNKQIHTIVSELLCFLETCGFEIVNLDKLLAVDAYEKF